MSGLFGTLHSASSGLSANQISIQTVNQNLVNMNTPGYSRQEVQLTAKNPYSRPGKNSSMYAGQLGQGVQVAGIVRARNYFYDYQYRSESHNYGESVIKLEHYKSIENVFNEPSDTSISASLNGLFNAFNELSKNPNSSSAKKLVVENAKIFSSSINQVSDKLDTLKNNIKTQEEGIMKDVNNILNELKKLDKDIKIVEATGKNPNDLLDRRDALIDELSFKVDINNEEVKNALSDGDFTLDEFKGIKDVSGELQAVRDMQKEVDDISKSMETLMNSIATEFNDVYKNDVSAPDTKDFFTLVTDASGKVSISVNQDFIDDPSQLVMSADKALAMSNIKSKKITIDGAQTTIGGFYNSTIQEIGYKTQEVSREESNRKALMLNIEKSKSSISGVSLDEEMASLIQFQHAYNASAKVVSTIDSLLDVVINGLIR